jgi:GNAT superfamily N-acetyltransferase
MRPSMLCMQSASTTNLSRTTIGRNKFIDTALDGSALETDELVGFVNVAWDGAGHAFLLDTMVTSRARRRGVGTKLVAVAVAQARAAGCEWLHVDFDDHLRSFYFDACGFVPTEAGLIAL